MVWGIIAAIIAVATSAASYMQAKKAEKLAAKQAEEMAAVQISGHNNNRSLYTVYGKALLGSTVVWKKLSGKRVQLPATNFLVKSAASGSDLTSQDSDTPKRYLYRAVTLCNGPVEDVTEVLVDGESYLSARFKQEHNRHFGTAISKGPTTGLYYNRLKNYSATDFAQWDSTKLGKGVAYAMERLYLDKDKPAFQGEPSTQYIVKGRLLYDPRLDSTVTGGSGSHRSNNSATWAYSDNPVLALLDYVTNTEYGRGLAHTDIDLASMITCANACDVLVDIPPRLVNEVDGFTVWINGVAVFLEPDFVFPQYREEQDSSTNKQKRYRINVAIDGSKEILDNIQQILNVFKGNLVYVNGKYKCVMADVASSVLSITDDDIIGGLTISDGDRSQRMNRATIKFTNENKDYKVDQVSWPEIGTSEYNAYLAEDQNEKLHRTFTIDGCTDYYQAEDTAEFIVREGRSGLTVSGTFGSRALALTPGDVVAVTYDSASYSGKYFRVQTVALNIQTMNVNLTLREYDSSVYTWNANKGNEPLGFSWHEEPVNLSPTSPSIGTISTTTHDQADTTAVIVMTVPFTGVPTEAHRVEVSASVQNENKFTTVNVTDLPTETSAAITLGRGGVTYDVRVRYIIVDANGTHLPSAFVRTTHAVPALASAIGTKVGGMSEGATANIIYRQDEPPTGTDHNAGDQWFDTNDGNKVYVWSGSNWVSVQDELVVGAVQPGDTNVNLGVRVGSGSSVFTIDSSGVYLGSETFSAAPFKVSPDGAATASKLTISGTTPTISIGTDTSDTVTLSTASDHRMWVGSSTPESSKFKIHKDGTLTAKGMHLQDGDASAYFGTNGFTDLAYSQIATNTQSRVNVFETSGNYNLTGTGLNALKVNLTTSSSLTITVKASNLFSGLSTGSVIGGLSQSETHAISQIPDNFTLALQKSTTSGTGGFSDLVTQTFTKVTSGSTSTTTYLVESTAYVPPGTTTTATPAQVNITNYASVSNLNADGDRVLENTSTYATGAVYFRVLLSTTDTSYDTNLNNVFSNWPRTLSIKDNGATGFTVINDDPNNREITQAAGTGDITSVVAGTNLNGGAVSGVATLNLDSTITGNHTFSDNLIIEGDLTVQGTTTTVDTDDLNVKDKNITLNYSTGDSSSTANGAGITIQDAVNSTTNATILWDATNDKFDFSHKLTTPSLDVGGALSVTGKAIINRNNGSVGAPNTANHDTGTRIELYNANATAWYAVGIEPSTMWFNSDANYKFYVDAVSKVDFDSSGVVNAVGGYKVDGTLKSGNWDTAYTYSQVGHLPLSGGTLTGGLSGTTASLSSTVSSGGGIASTGSTSVASSSINIGFVAPNGEIKAKNTSSNPAANLDFFTTNSSGNTLLAMRVTWAKDVSIGRNLSINGTLDGVSTITANSYKVGSQEVITSGRALTNLSGITTTSGSITSYGSIKAGQGGIYTNNVERITNAGNLTNIKELNATGRINISAGTGISEAYVQLGITNTANSAGLFLDASNGGRKYEMQSTTTGELIFYDRDSNAYRARILANGNFKIEQNSLQMGNTVVIDASRNATFASIDLPNANNWSYIKNNTASGGLRFGTKNATGTYSDQIEISATGNYVKLNRNTIVSGTISSGAITSTGVSSFGNGTTIGAVELDGSTIGNQQAGLTFQPNSAYRCIHPTSMTTTAHTSDISLGWSNNKWKDIYLAGFVKADSGYQVGTTTVIDASRIVQNVTLKHGTSGSRFQADGWFYDTGTQRARFYFENNGRTFFGSGNGYNFRDSADTTRFTISNNGGLNLLSGGEGHVGSTVAMAVGGQTVIDSSRNATFVDLSAQQANLNTTSAPNFTSGVTGLRISRSGGPNAGDYGNGITFGQHYWTGDTSNIIRTAGIYGKKTIGNGSFGGGLEIFTQPNGGANMSVALSIDHTQAATFSGTISSGAITSSGTLKIHKTGDDSVINVDGNGGYDPVISWRSDQQSSIAGEGFQIWYDNSVGDVHLHTTYANDVAAIRFHTRTGTDKATNNERFTINGNGNIDIVSGALSMGGQTVIDSSKNISAGTISSGAITATADIKANDSRVRIGNPTNLSGRSGIRIDTTGDSPADLLFGDNTSSTSWTNVNWGLSSRATNENQVFRIYRGVGQPSPYNSEAVALEIARDLSATFAGTISSGAITADGGATLNGVGTSSSTYPLRVFNGASTPDDLLSIKDDGTIIMDGPSAVVVNKGLGLSVSANLGVGGQIYNSSGDVEVSGGFKIASGGLKMGTATTTIEIIDSSRNLTNIGTISSGAITTSSDITLNGGHDLHLVKTHSNNGVDLVYGQITFGDTTSGQYVNHARIESGGAYANNADLRFHTSNNNSSPVRFQMTNIGEFKVGTTTILDQSRNLTNIGTISSGAISSSSAINGTYFSDGYIQWGAAQLNRYGAAIELQFTPTNAATLVKIGANGSNPTTFNAYTGAATFSGTISSGAITSTSSILGLSLAAQSGNVSNGFNSTQIRFGYAGSASYQQAIKTRHNSSTGTGNAIDFFLWDSGTDAVGSVGTLRIASIETGKGIDIVDGGLQIGGTTVIDASRNITISEDLNFSTNGYADISNTGTGAIRFKPSSQTLALTLAGANATFAGTISSGSITTTGNFINNTNGGIFLKSNTSEANNWLFKENSTHWGMYYFNAGSQAGATVGAYTTVGAEYFFTSSVSGYGPAMPSTWTGTQSGSYLNIMLSPYKGYIYAGDQIEAKNGYRLNGTTVINASRVVENVTLGHGTTGSRFEVDDWLWDSGSRRRFYFENTGRTYFGSGGGYVFRDSSDVGNATISNNGGLNLLSGGDGLVGSTVALAVSGQTVIDSSRNLSNIGTATVITLKETDGGDGFTEMGPASSGYGYFSWGHEIALSGSGYAGLRFAGKKKYFELEADILGVSANHQGFFWGNVDGTTTYGGSSSGYKTTHQSSTIFHIRDVNGNANQATINPGFAPNDGAWHHQKITATPDGYIRVWLDGVLVFELTGYIPSAAGYLGFINYTGTVRYANIRCRTINAEETQFFGAQKIANAVSAYASTDKFVSLYNPTANKTGTLVTANNGNTWLNADGGKTLWLNWISKTNSTSKADLRVGDGNYGSDILSVTGGTRRVGINRTTPSQTLDVGGAIAINGTTVIDASRNLSNIGTINSGSITAAGIAAGSVSSTAGSITSYGALYAGQGGVYTNNVERISNAGHGTFDRLRADGGNLIMGDEAFSQSGDYVGMKTAFQSGSTDYMILSGVADGATYVSAKDGQRVHIRGGGNNSANEIQVLDGNYILATTPEFRVSGAITTTSDVLVGNTSGAAYNTLSGGQLYFADSDLGDKLAYSIGLKRKENINGDYTKLNIDWHTGITLGASPTYGGIRFFNNSVGHYNSTTKLFSIGEGSQNAKCYNSFDIGGSLSMNGTDVITSSRAITNVTDISLTGSINVGDAKTVGHGAISLKYDLVYMTAGVISPSNSNGTDNDNAIDLGKSAARFNDIFATNGTIQTSDQNEKQDIEDLTDAEERVAVAAKGLLKKFRWKNAVEDKGDDARIHFGIIAQDLQAAFEAEGLDAGRYGMFTSNTWTDENGEEQTRMGVRYSELLAFIISAI